MQLRRMIGRGVRAGLLALVGMGCAATAGAAGNHGRMHPFKVDDGVLTVDGMTARHGLSLRTANLHYLFVYVPGEGTAVVAQQPFEGAHPQKAAFHGNSLTIVAGGRRIELTSPTSLRNRTAYVRFERGTVQGMRVPAVAFGETSLVPAVWPVEDETVNLGHRRVSVRSRRALRSGKLCRPSPHGHELCAVIHEVVYKPW